MGRVLRTPQALADLDEIWSYIAKRNLSAADRLLDRLYARFQKLAEYPDSGERQPLLRNGDYRRIVEGNYVIYYVSKDSDVTIVRVLHAARDESELL